MRYNWQQPDWPNFSYELSELEPLLQEYLVQLGKLDGLIHGLSEQMQADAVIDLMVVEAINTSEIEGEFYSRVDIMSSVKNNLGLNNPTASVKNPGAAGIAELMASVRNTWADPLSEDTLFAWHSMVLVNAPRRVEVGCWRNHPEPMQIVSGAIGKTKVHFEAPPSKNIRTEMNAFLEWFNRSAPDGPPTIQHAAVRAAISHLYFETIHPFEDGNGRIGRAIAEKVLAQGAGHPVLFSVSKAIHQDKTGYYQALQQAQRSNQITAWIRWFVQTLVNAQQDAEQQITFTLKKSRFLDRYKEAFNARQSKAVLRMLAEGPKGFEGGMSQAKYVGITGTSTATATRDLSALVEMGAMVAQGAGRSRRYSIRLEKTG